MSQNSLSASSECETYEFGSFCLDPISAQLLKDGQPIPLVRKAFETLYMLVKHHGQVVEKDFLLTQLWPDTFVEEGNLTQYIYLLRKSLNGNESEDYIETVHKHGYRFVADVRVVSRSGLAATPTYESERGSAILISPQQSGIDTEPRPLPTLNRSSLRLILIASVAVIFLSLLIGSVYFRSPKVQNVDNGMNHSSLAVLPFKQIGSEHNHLGLGMADALITRMGKLQLFPVRPTSAVMRFEETKVDAAQAGKSLGVDAVLTGTIQREGDRLLVTVQLINVKDGNQIWADRFEEKFTNVFDVQDSISEKAVRSLRLKLSTEKEASLKKRYTTSGEAYEAYATGYYFWSRRTKEDLFKAVDSFQRAIELDSNYALAHAGLADTYIMIAFYHYGPMQDYTERAKTAVFKAMEIDPTIAEAYIPLAEIQRANNDPVAAEQSFRKAIELAPYNATAHMRYGWLLANNLKIVEAEREMRLAQEYDPLSIIHNVALAQILVFRRNDEEAIKYALKAINLESNSLHAAITLALIYSRQGRHEEALALLENRQESSLYESSLKALIYAKARRKQEALKLIAALEKNPATKEDAAYTLGLAYFELGEKEKALHWIEVSLRNNEVPSMALAFDPDLDAVRTEAEYQEILRRVRSGTN